MEDERLFLYPSFEPLDPWDFCRFGHLPVYPLGMMTRYALNADGDMMTPLRFLEHDVIHLRNNCTWQLLDSERPLDSPWHRLLFRQTLLDGLPATLRTPGLERAVVLVLFFLLHERDPSTARELMEEPHFLPLLNKISKVRRVDHYDYPAAYRAIGDFEAILACRWVHWMYRCCSDTQVVCSDQKARSWHFVEEVLPGLIEHWQFFAAHRKAIHDWLLSTGQVHESQYDGLKRCYPSPSKWVRIGCNYGQLTFQEDTNSRSEGPVCYTDVAFFDILQNPAEEARLMAALQDESRQGRRASGSAVGPRRQRWCRLF